MENTAPTELTPTSMKKFSKSNLHLPCCLRRDGEVAGSTPGGDGLGGSGHRHAGSVHGGLEAVTDGIWSGGGGTALKNHSGGGGGGGLLLSWERAGNPAGNPFFFPRNNNRGLLLVSKVTQTRPTRGWDLLKAWLTCHPSLWGDSGTKVGSIAINK